MSRTGRSENPTRNLRTPTDADFGTEVFAAEASPFGSERFLRSRGSHP